MDIRAAQLLAEKLTRELFRIAQAYGKQHPYRFEDLTHDFGVMLEHDGLHSLSLKFHRPNAQREVLVEYNYALHTGQPKFHIDDAQGLSIVPLAPPFEMGLIINRDACDGVYEDRLRLSWSSAPRYSRYGGFAHRDGNTTRRTGGRASKEIYMDHTLRQRGNIKFYLPGKLYGFITGEAGSQPGSDIFFHAKNVQGFEPCRGQRVSFLPMVTPKGVQAKDIRLA